MAPKISKAERERQKREEQERVAAAEAERLRLEKEEEERRKEQLRIEEEQRQKELEEKHARFDVEKKVVQALEYEQRQALIEQKERIAKDKEWQHHLECKMDINVTDVKAVNVFLRQWEDAELDSKTALAVTVATWQEANDLQERLRHQLVEEEEMQADEKRIATYRELIAQTQELMARKLDDATRSVLVSADDFLHPESFNLDVSCSCKDMFFYVWGNKAKNPRLTNIKYRSRDNGQRRHWGCEMSLPGQLVMANVACRCLHTTMDNLSPTSRFYGVRDVFLEQQPAEDVDLPDGGNGDSAEDGSKSQTSLGSATGGEKAEGSATGGPEKTVSTASLSSKQEPRDAAKSSASGRVGSKVSLGSGAGDEHDDDEEEAEEAVQQEEPDPDFPKYEDLKHELGSECVVDLRQYRPVGGVYHFDLMDMPPQAKQHPKTGWWCQQVALPCLQYTTYPLPDTRKKPAEEEEEETPVQTPAPNAQRQAKGGAAPPDKNVKPEGRGAPEVTVQEVEFDVCMRMSCVHSDEVRVARWEAADRCWRWDGIKDIYHDVAEGSISFSMPHIAPFAVMQDLYAHLPLESWTVCPSRDRKSVIITLRTSLAAMEVEIKDAQCRLLKEKEEEVNEDEVPPPDPLADLREKWMTLEELKMGLIGAGVNIYPLEDGHAFANCTKKMREVEREVYRQMAILGGAFAFEWSKWGLQSKRNEIILKVVENPGDTPIPDERWSLYVVTDDGTWPLQMKTNDDGEKYSLDIENGKQVHADLFSAVKTDASPASCAAIADQPPLTASHIAKFLQSTQPVVFS